MPRLGTSNLNLGTWLDNENPGAGSQSVDNTGLNGNWLKIDVAVGNEHNANGTHKAGSILKAYLHSGVADGSTLELDVSAGLRIKDLGVTSAKIAANAVIAGKLADGAVDTTARLANNIVSSTKLQDSTVTTTKIADLNVTNGKIANNAIDTNKITDDAVTAPKIFADAVTSAKIQAGAVTTAKIADGNVTTQKLEYKEYVATLSQAGADSAPVANVIRDTIGGSKTWGFVSSAPGRYTFTATTGLFTTGKTVVLLSTTLSSFIYYGLSDTEIDLFTKNTSNTFADNLLNGTTIIIRVYP